MSNLIIEKVLEQYNKYKDTKYSYVVSEAIDLCFNEQHEKALAKIESLPKVMLADLVEKLKGKSVYTGIKDLLEGRLDNTIDNLKVLSSLKTHCLIEMKTNPEYKELLEIIENKYLEIRGKI